MTFDSVDCVVRTFYKYRFRLFLQDRGEATGFTAPAESACADGGR